MSLDRSKLRQLLKVAAVVLVPFALLSIHFFVISNADLKTEPKKAQNKNAEKQQFAEIDVESLDIGDEKVYSNTGIASYYADDFHNQLTANGEIFNMNEYSAAHKKLPFGTILKVTNLITNKTTFVRINDRGPYIGKRIIDLSYRSAQAIDGISSGTSKVKIEGFLAGKHKNLVNSENTDDYLYAYSFDKEPLCVPSEVFSKVDSSRKFHNAVKKYKRFMKNNPDDDYFLMVEPEKISRKEKYGNTVYYIGAPKRVALKNNNLQLSSL